jgi:hypothetical protein
MTPHSPTVWRALAGTKEMIKPWKGHLLEYPLDQNNRACGSRYSTGRWSVPRLRGRGEQGG